MKRTRDQNDLADAIESLTQQVIVLRQVVDELTTEIQWRNQNQGPSLVSFHRRIDSFSIDPVKRDFEVNSVPPNTIQQLRESVSTPGTKPAPETQGHLFG